MDFQLLLFAGYKSVAHYLVLSNLAAAGEDAAPDGAEASPAASGPAVTEPVPATAPLAAGEHLAPT